MAILVPVAKVQPDKSPRAVANSALVNLLGVMVELVAVTCTVLADVNTGGCLQRKDLQMLGPRIALSATLFWTLKLLVQALTAPPPFPRRPFRVGRVSITVSIVGVV